MADILQIVRFVCASNYNDWCIMWWGLMKFLVYLFVSSLLWMHVILTCNFFLSFVMHTFVRGNYTVFNLVHLLPCLLYSILLPHALPLLIFVLTLCTLTSFVYGISNYLGWVFLLLPDLQQKLSIQSTAYTNLKPPL